MPDDPDAEREDLDKLKEFQADLESAGKGKGPFYHMPTGYAREMAERLGRVLGGAESKVSALRRAERAVDRAGIIVFAGECAYPTVREADDPSAEGLVAHHINDPFW